MLELTLKVSGGFFSDRDFGGGELHLHSFVADIIGIARPPDARRRNQTPVRHDKPPTGGTYERKRWTT